MSDAKDKLNAFDDNDEIMSWCDRDTYKGSETYVHLHGLYGLAVEFSDEIERLRAALRPFAEAADGFDMTRIKNPEEWFAYRGIVSATESRGAITVGDLRRARAALEGKDD